MPEPHENETAFPKELLDKIAEAIGLSNPSKRSLLEYHLRDMRDDAASYRMRRVVREPGKLTVFGGSGFLGRQIVKSLAAEGTNVRVAVRHPERAPFIERLGRDGQIELVHASIGVLVMHTVLGDPL